MDAEGALAALLKGLGPDRAAEAAAATNLGTQALSLLQVARGVWPRLPLDPGLFLTYVGVRLPPHVPLEDALASLHADDLYLACGAASGDRAALEILDRVGFAQLEAALASLAADGIAIDDVKQAVRERLFVPDAKGRRRIEDYAGRGSLRRWIRAAALHTALNQRRGRRDFGGHDDLVAALPSPAENPELAYLRAHDRTVFADSFRAALAALTPRERNLLAQYYVDGLTIDDLGALYRVNRVTAFRWIGKARRELSRLLRADLAERLGLASAEIDSLVKIVKSRLDVTMRSALGR